MTGNELFDCFNSPKAQVLFSSLYGEEGADSARQRYSRLAAELPEGFSGQEFGLRVFSVPGRTELGGNHTDHNRGKVLAASIQLDVAAVAAARKDKQVFFRSSGHRDVKLDLSNLSRREEETGTTEALIRGIAAEFSAQGTPVNGFTANADNMVLTGSGLSSSAAVEVLFAKIFDNLYCGGKRSAMDLAKIGQKAENTYFGKPCGLMDQTACATGGVVAIDFGGPEPLVRRIDFDPGAAGFALCVVNTGGSHSDLTPDYAAIPGEMKQTAAFFGNSVLRELDEKAFMTRLTDLRKAAGDRAVLRALHFFNENRRVEAMLKTLEDMNAERANSKKSFMDAFLALARESGNSSRDLLQNIYSPKNPAEQGIGLALALTENFLNSKDGACRVHGGGFAGTIQAYLPTDKLEEYRGLVEGVFGKGALTVLRIRPQGAIELNF
jgi:galactokinase